MAPVVVDPAKVHEFPTFDAFYQWLAANHASADEVWIRMFKKASGVATISPKEAIDAALCWGWIDAIRKGNDEVSFFQRYTPRGRKSVWSRVNVDNIARLERTNMMTHHGRAHVEAAKSDGRWDRAYGANTRDMPIPPELAAAIAAEPLAQQMFDVLTAQNRFALAFRIHNLKTEAGRKKRIAAFVDMLKRGETIYPQKAGRPESSQ